MTDFEIHQTPTKDWEFGIITAADLDIEPGDKLNLVKVVISLQKHGNIQIGETRIGVTGTTTVQRNTIDLDGVGPCTDIHNCADVRQD